MVPPFPRTRRVWEAMPPSGHGVGPFTIVLSSAQRSSSLNTNKNKHRNRNKTATTSTRETCGMGSHRRSSVLAALGASCGTPSRTSSIVSSPGTTSDTEWDYLGVWPLKRLCNIDGFDHNKLDRCTISHGPDGQKFEKLIVFCVDDAVGKQAIPTRGEWGGEIALPLWGTFWQYLKNWDMHLTFYASKSHSWESLLQEFVHRYEQGHMTYRSAAGESQN